MQTSGATLLLASAASLLFAGGVRAQGVMDLRGKPIGSLREPFSRISGVRELSDGRVIVTDPIERAIVAGDLTTGRSTRIGRAGEGPNEYRFPASVFAGPAGESWVPDPPLSRIHEVTPEGIRGELVMPKELTGFPSLRGTDRAGNFYFEGSSYSPEGFSDSVPVIRWNSKTNATEAIARVWSGGRVTLRRASGPMSVARGITPFPAVDAWVVLPAGGIAIIRHAPYRIDIVTGPGQVRVGGAISTAALPVTARDRSEFRTRAAGQGMRAVGKGGRSGPAGPGLEFEDADFPALLPPFRGDAVLVSPEGEIWIGRSLPAGSAMVEYDVHDSAGKLLARAQLKPNSSVVGFGRGAVYIARQDPEDDLLYLEKVARPVLPR